MRTAVMIYSCDAYSDIWEPFFTLFFRYWKCPYPVYIATETETCVIEGVKTVNSFGIWTERMRSALEQIPADYVICMCEDMFIRRPVKQEVIDSCIGWLEEDPSIACFNFEKGEDNLDPSRYFGFGFRRDWKKSCQPAIWRKSILEKLLDCQMEPWQWEESPASDEYKYYVFTGDDADLVFEYGYHDGKWFGVQKGKWVAEDVGPLFKKEGISVNLSIRGTI